MVAKRVYRKRKMGVRKTIKKPAKLSKSVVLAVKKIANRQMNRVAETKCIDNTSEPVPLSCYYHNVTYIHDTDMLWVNQGVKDEESGSLANRIGDSIFVKNISLKLLITNFSTRPNLLYRISVLKVKNGAVSLPNPYTHPACGNAIIAPIDTEDTAIISVEYDRVFNTLAYQTAQTGNADKKFVWLHNIKVNKKVRYDNGSTAASNFTYRLYVTCYDTQGAYITDNVARFTYFRRVHFLDA